MMVRRAILRIRARATSGFTRLPEREAPRHGIDTSKKSFQLHGATVNPEIAPTLCCGPRSMRCDGPYSLKPLRQRERASVGYAFSQRASALAVREAAQADAARLRGNSPIFRTATAFCFAASRRPRDENR